MHNWYTIAQSAGKKPFDWKQFGRGVALSPLIALPMYAGGHEQQRPLALPHQTPTTQPTTRPATQPTTRPDTLKMPSTQKASLDLAALASKLADEEGFRTKVYPDPIHDLNEDGSPKPIDEWVAPTIGVGHKIVPNDQALANVTGMSPVAFRLGKARMTEAQVKALLELDLQTALSGAKNTASGYDIQFDSLPLQVQETLVTMAFQMGAGNPTSTTPGGLAAFRSMFAAIKAGKYNEMADHMLDSKWARQTPGRAQRSADAIRQAFPTTRKAASCTTACRRPQ